MLYFFSRPSPNIRGGIRAAPRRAEPPRGGPARPGSKPSGQDRRRGGPSYGNDRGGPSYGNVDRGRDRDRGKEKKRVKFNILQILINTVARFPRL